MARSRAASASKSATDEELDVAILESSAASEGILVRVLYVS